MSDNPFPGYVHGEDAARVFGVADAASVWRAIARHAADYPGSIEVVEVGRRKMVRRVELERFTAWFAAGPGRNDTRLRVGATEDVVEETETVVQPKTAAARPGLEARRAKLREAIAQLMGM